MPTTPEKAFAWWRAALAGEKVPIHHDDPHPGFYMRRLVRNGPFVPVAVFLESDVDSETGELLGPERLVCDVAGERRDANDQWTWIAGRPISEARYMQMLSDLLPEFEPEPRADPAAPTAPSSPSVPMEAGPQKGAATGSKPSDVPY